MNARVLAVDDDPSLRMLVSNLLGGAGYEVELAAEGGEALDRIRRRAPDLVLCDIQMPGLDGFAVLERVRSDRSTAALPFVLLTGQTDRDSVRRGMRLGADDFLYKPLQPSELVETIGSTLDKRRRLLEESELAAITGRSVTQTVLFCDMRGFTAMSERLPVGEVAELLTHYLRETCRPILDEGGRIMKIMGDGVMATFGHERPEDTAAHAAAGLRAGLRIIEVAQEFRRWVASRFDLPGLRPFDVGVGVHTGEVMLFQLSVAGSGEVTAVGDTVNVAARLEAKSKELGWPIVASLETISLASKDSTVPFQVLETREVELSGRGAPIRVGRVSREVARAAAAPATLSGGVAAVIEESARATALAAKAALDRTLHAIEDARPAGEQEPVVNGYRVLAKIGEGGMSSVYLAEEASGARKVVLKVLKGRRGDDDGLWKRFFQECAILSSIHHDNVVRIYDQGFGDELAYIAMEHLSGGSLREVIDKGLSARQALSLLSQAAGGLAEIHRCGIVHRDIKPANLMLRANGVLVLTDFGVAKRVDATAGQTSHGEILGTPYYLSPEQAQGGEVTPRSDLYSLGVIFHEMLTGQRPYAGGTILEILAQHISAPLPRLPQPLAAHQRLLEGLLAKQPQDRFADADALLDAIDQVWTRLSLQGGICSA
jgi:class 3 adenylate cyclase/predicted Ser/Thr protein kinase